MYSVTSNHIYVLLVDDKKAQLFRLQNNNLKANIRNLNNALVTGDTKTFDDLAEELYMTLFEPVQSSLQNKELFIVPD